MYTVLNSDKGGNNTEVASIPIFCAGSAEFLVANGFSAFYSGTSASIGYYWTGTNSWTFGNLNSITICLASNCFNSNRQPGWIDSGGNTDVYGILPVRTPPCNPCSIFTTASTTPNGNLGSTWDNIDNLCMVDSNKPNDKLIYKAMLVGNNNGIARQACTSANCATGGSSENINWVLHPNTVYNWAGTTNQVFTTNSTGIAPMPIPNQGAPSAAVLWTGLNQDWTTDSANTCSGWTSTSGNGRLGNRASPNGNFIGAISRACSDSRQLLYCVSQ